MNLLIIPRAKLPAAAWDAFVGAHRSGWFWHTARWLDYGLSLGGDRADLSFAVVNSASQLVGLCPLIREGARGTFEGAPGAWPLLTPASRSHGVFVEIERHGLDVRFRSCPVASPPPHCDELAIGWSSRVLDLAPAPAVLHASLRKSYKALINAVPPHQIHVDDRGELMSAYQAVHRAVGGTRPDETYQHQARWIDAGQAFLVGARHAGRWAAFAYVFFYKQAAYYGSGPSLAPNLQHAVVWRAIVEAKARGARVFELGWGPRAGNDDKDKAIAFFKQGFGGQDMPVWTMKC